MVYVGGKQKITKYIVPIIQGYIDKSGYKTYVEPFVGGANVICKIKAEERIGFDTNKYLIAFLKAIAEGELSVFHLPSLSEKQYIDVRDFPERYRESFVGYAGSMYGYCGKFFGSYVQNQVGGRNLKAERLRNLISQCYPHGYDRKSLYNALSPIKFGVSSYENLNAERCVIYCDPPYNKTYNYGVFGDMFESAKLWDWVRYMSTVKNNIVLVSEQEAPDDFKILWEKKVTRSLSNSQRKTITERLYIMR